MQALHVAELGWRGASRCGSENNWSRFWSLEVSTALMREFLTELYVMESRSFLMMLLAA